LTPIFIIYLINDNFLAALIVFILAGFSDAADGAIARLFDQKSKLGSYLDPLADKILLVAGFIALAIRGFVPPWLTVVVISRDVLILLGVLILFLSGTTFTVRPSILSKLTTCVQITAVSLALSQRYLALSGRMIIYIYGITGGLTIASGLHYMRYWFGMMGEEGLERQKKEGSG